MYGCNELVNVLHQNSSISARLKVTLLIFFFLGGCYTVRCAAAASPNLSFFKIFMIFDVKLRLSSVLFDSATV